MHWNNLQIYHSDSGNNGRFIFRWTLRCLVKFNQSHIETNFGWSITPGKDYQIILETSTITSYFMMMFYLKYVLKFHSSHLKKIIENYRCLKFSVMTHWRAETITNLLSFRTYYLKQLLEQANYCPRWNFNWMVYLTIPCYFFTVALCPLTSPTNYLISNAYSWIVRHIRSKVFLFISVITITTF